MFSLSYHFVFFSFGNMQEIGLGLTERDLYKFKSDSSKILRMSVLTDTYFLLKLLFKNDFVAVRSESDAPYTARPYVEIR